MAIEQIFKNLLIVEFANAVAGPAAGLFFAELGARVIKIENKRSGGDITRNWNLSSEHKDALSAYYCSVNWGKESIFLDLANEKELGEAMEIVAEADIVISNFKLSSAKKLKVDYEALKSIKPDLIYAQVYSYSKDDNTPAFDVVIQAETGYLSMCGEENSGPVKMPVAMIDILAAHQLKEAILIALLKRSNTGDGSFVSISLYDAAISSLLNQATNWLMNEMVPARMGSKHPNIAPYGDLYRCKDGKLVVLAIGTERHFHSMCKEIDALAITEDPRFNSNKSRLKHRRDLNEEIQARMESFNAQEVVKNLKKHGVPCGIVRSMDEVFEVAQAQQMVLSKELPSGQAWKCVKSVAFEFLSENAD